MTQQIINIGAAPNDGTGDPDRTAWIKANANFTELYARGGLTAPQGRLTLQTATPVMTTTQAAKTTIFYTPYVGNQVPIYDGTNMVMTTFAELSVTTTDTTKSPAAIGVSKVNDWFVWSDAGTIRVGHGPDWTNDTTRSAGTALAMVNGVLLNNASITNGPAAQRGTYVGTTRSNASSQLDWIFGVLGGTAAWFGVWNAYNRIAITSQSSESTSNWAYASATPRRPNGGTAACANFVSGLAEDAILGCYIDRLWIGVGSAYISVGLDGASTLGVLAWQTSTVGQGITVSSSAAFPPQVGFHFVTGIEASDSVNNNTFWGSSYQSLVFNWRA